VIPAVDEDGLSDPKIRVDDDAGACCKVYNNTGSYKTTHP